MKILDELEKAHHRGLLNQRRNIQRRLKEFEDYMQRERWNVGENQNS